MVSVSYRFCRGAEGKEWDWINCKELTLVVIEATNTSLLSAGRMPRSAEVLFWSVRRLTHQKSWRRKFWSAATQDEPFLGSTVTAQRANCPFFSFSHCTEGSTKLDNAHHLGRKMAESLLPIEILISSINILKIISEEDLSK